MLAVAVVNLGGTLVDVTAIYQTWTTGVVALAVGLGVIWYQIADSLTLAATPGDWYVVARYSG